MAGCGSQVRAPGRHADGPVLVVTVAVRVGVRADLVADHLPELVRDGEVECRALTVKHLRLSATPGWCSRAAASAGAVGGRTIAGGAGKTEGQRVTPFTVAQIAPSPCRHSVFQLYPFQLGTFAIGCIRS